MAKRMIFRLIAVFFFVLLIGGNSVWASWSEPVLLEELNGSGAIERARDPYLSQDRLTMYFSRYIESLDTLCIVEAYRTDPIDTFISERVVSELFDGKQLRFPWVSGDELRLYYSELTSSGKWIINVAERATKSNLWTFERTLSEINVSGYYDSHPELSEDELSLYFVSDQPGTMGGGDIWMATRASVSESFSNVANLTEINDTLGEGGPSLTADGLTMYFSSKRDGDSYHSIYKAERSSTSQPFENIQLIDDIFSSSCADQGPYITKDENMLFFYRPINESSPDQLGIWATSVIPEPATLLLLTLGILALRKKT